MINFRPMLAATVVDEAKLCFPLLASPKLDGVRAINMGGQLVSRNLKPIRNQHVQNLFGGLRSHGFDGELIVGEATSPTVFRETESAVMSIAGEPSVQFHVFDDLTHDDHGRGPFEARLRSARRRLEVARRPGMVLVQHVFVQNVVELSSFEDRCLDMGYEGVMLRHPAGLYKFGRSTLKEGLLMKLKRFDDAEAQIIGFEELMHNGNESKINALGASERSSHKSGMVGRKTLGALEVIGLNGSFAGVTFKIGTGFDDKLRSEIWSGRQHWRGRVVKYKYFAAGVKDKPRFPVYLGTRSDL